MYIKIKIIWICKILLCIIVTFEVKYSHEIDVIVTEVT